MLSCMINFTYKSINICCCDCPGSTVFKICTHLETTCDSQQLLNTVPHDMLITSFLFTYSTQGFTIACHVEGGGHFQHLSLQYTCSTQYNFFVCNRGFSHFLINDECMVGFPFQELFKEYCDKTFVSAFLFKLLVKKKKNIPNFLVSLYIHCSYYNNKLGTFYIQTQEQGYDIISVTHSDIGLKNTLNYLPILFTNSPFRLMRHLYSFTLYLNVFFRNSLICQFI